MYKYVRRWGIALLISLAVIAPVEVISAEDLRDPTQPLTRAALKSASGRFRLHSVLISDSRRIAIINGRRVRENSTIGGAKVVRILPGRVIIRKNGVEKTLILKSIVTKPRSG